MRLRGLWKLPGGRDWTWGNLGLVLMGRAMLSKHLIRFSVDGWGWVLSLYFSMRPNCGGGNGCNGDLLQKDFCQQPPRPPGPWYSVPLMLRQATVAHASARVSWTLRGKSGSISCPTFPLLRIILLHGIHQHNPEYSSHLNVLNLNLQSSVFYLEEYNHRSGN